LRMRPPASNTSVSGMLFVIVGRPLSGHSRRPGIQATGSYRLVSVPENRATAVTERPRGDGLNIAEPGADAGGGDDAPFVLQTIVQLGFGLNPFASGSLVLRLFADGLGMKIVTTRLLRPCGFRAAPPVKCDANDTGHSGLRCADAIDPLDGDNDHSIRQRADALIAVQRTQFARVRRHASCTALRTSKQLTADQPKPRHPIQSHRDV
jgi:hypothetical protein